MKKKGRIGTSFAIITAICILITALSVFFISYMSLGGLAEDALESNCKDITNRIYDKINIYIDEATESATHLAAYESLIASVEEKDSEKVLEAIDKYNTLAGIDENAVVTVTDQDGIVIARSSTADKGDDISNLTYIKRCKQGETVSETEKGDDIKLGAVCGTPIKNADGQQIGILSLTYTLEDPEFLDVIKGETDTEYTIFVDDTRYNTTLKENGQRMLGTKMDNDVKETVIQKKQDYSGLKTLAGVNYMTTYEPLENADGDVIGAIYAGIPMTEVDQGRNNAIGIIMAVIVVVVVIVVILMIAFAKRAVVIPVVELVNAADEMANGNLSATVKHIPNNEIGTLAESLRAMISTFKMCISDIIEKMSALDSGDMTQQIDHEYVGDFQAIKQSINKITSHLNTTLTTISTAADQVNSGAEQVATAAQSLSQGATEQASSIQELTSSIMSVSEQVNQTAKNVNVAGDYIHESQNGIQNSNNSMEHMVSAMNDINDSSMEISKIIKVIDDIAFQTNILALNAAVEAARAGAAGKGFSVVADEVRNLASKSADAAKQTTRLIEGSVASVQKGSKIAMETAKDLEAVNEQYKLVVETIQKIQDAATQQAEAINQITIGLEQVSSVVQTNSATSEESAAASEELSGQAQMLHQELSQFKLSETIGNYSASGSSYSSSDSSYSASDNDYSVPDDNYSAPVISHSAEPAPVYHADPSTIAPPPITINLDDDKY
ncbi:MAG: methyl-accepting chemotaxis protein [Clostridium sp.]|nr:methyl-accepting chemotaxis protein [Clostridium sp.]MCM1547140.1 methyl-accepting chemotaxis protein [Ruminococcus sp.]